MKLGVRRSKLAMAYAQKVIDALPFPDVEIVPIVTEGDIKSNTSIQEIGGKGVFVTEIEKHLLEKKQLKVDISDL